MPIASLQDPGFNQLIEPLLDKTLPVSRQQAGVQGLDDAKRELTQLGENGQPLRVGISQAASQKFSLLTKFLTPNGRRRIPPRSSFASHAKASEMEAGTTSLHGPNCTCERCMAQLELLSGHDPPEPAKP